MIPLIPMIPRPVDAHKKGGTQWDEKDSDRNSQHLILPPQLGLVYQDSLPQISIP